MANNSPIKRSPKIPSPSGFQQLVLFAGFSLSGILFWIALAEIPRVSALQKVAEAQATFREQSISQDGIPRYGTREELIRAGLLDLGCDVDTAPATDAPGERWWATSDPLHPLTGRGFFTNQSGTISRSSTPIRPRVNRATADPPTGLKLVYP